MTFNTNTAFTFFSTFITENFLYEKNPADHYLNMSCVVFLAKVIWQKMKKKTF